MNGKTADGPIEVLALAAQCGVALALEDGRIAAAPADGVTEELRELIRTKRESLMEHLRMTNTSEVYAAIADAAALGVEFRVGPDPDRLKASPASKLTPELAVKLREHKREIVAEFQDRAYRDTGILQCARHAFEEAREFFAAETKSGAA